MTLAYYNDNDPAVVEWLRNLITAGLLPKGDVDGRSIKEIQGTDLKGYTGAHFFAGIGVWPKPTKRVTVVYQDHFVDGVAQRPVIVLSPNGIDNYLFGDNPGNGSAQPNYELRGPRKVSRFQTCCANPPNHRVPTSQSGNNATN